MATLRLLGSLLLAVPVFVSGLDPVIADSRLTNSAAAVDSGAIYRQALVDAEQDREALIFDIVESWRAEMNALSYADGWDAELTAALQAASPEKLLAASEATTYASVVEALIGHASIPEMTVLGEGTVAPATLGSTTSDLVFTPVTPCRIIDTRSATGALSGRIGPDSGRQFQVNLPDFSPQGGSTTNCGMPSFEVSAVAINVTSTSQTGNGSIAVTEAGAAVPTTSLLNYRARANLANAAIIRTSTLVGDDIYIHSNFSATHVVVDIMGYYTAPEDTQVDQYVMVSDEVL